MVPRYALRPATVEDAALAFRIEEDAMRAYAEETWGYWAPARDPVKYLEAFDPEDQFVVVVGGLEVGIIALVERESEIELGKLYLLSSHRGRGLGSALLESIVSRASSCGKPLRLRTLAVNTRAQAFYLRHGFDVERADQERVFFVIKDT